MKKLKLLLATCALLLSTGQTWAQTDVTSTYLTNADFEGKYSSYAQPKSDRDIYQPEGWAISYTNGESNDMTSLNSSTTTQWSNFSGKPQPTNGGTNVYWMRFRWGGSENITLSQETSSALPAGTYAVSVNAYSDDNTGTVTISAAGSSQTVGTDGIWRKHAVVFTLASDQKITVSLSYTNTAGDEHAAAFDNVKIYQLSEPTGIVLKNELSGTAANLSDFNVWYDDYTLEVEGTAGTEITVAADNISYTPENTGTVRFVKKDGIVYVYEGTSYKTVVHSYKADYTYTTTLTDGDNETNNLLQNGSFETPGDVLTADKAWKLGSPWEVGNFSWGGDGSGVRVQANGSTKRLVWRGTGNRYFAQLVSSVKAYKGYKMYVRQVAGGNGFGDFRFGLGSAAGTINYLFASIRLGIKGSTQYNNIYEATFGGSADIPGSGAYFSCLTPTSARNAADTQSSNDPVTQIDWIGLVGSDDFPITGVSSASYVYGAAYAPATAKSSYLAAKAEAEAIIEDATYTNVTGSERTALQAQINADIDDNDAAYNTATEAIQTAQETFIAAKDSYDAYVAAKADAEGVNETDVLAVVIAGSNTATAADALAASIILPKAFAVKAATASEPVVTSFVVNGNFGDSDISKWSCNNSFQNKGRKTSDDDNAGNMNSNKPWWENWNGSALVNKMYQTIENIPNGTYRLDITAFVNNFDAESQYVFANSDQTPLTDDARSGANYEVYTVVTNNQVEVGLEQTTATANWMGIDNVSLRYYGAGNVIEAAKTAVHKKGWDEAKDAAEAAIANDDYANVTGSEKTALETEIGKEEPTTNEGYDTAAEAMISATQTFVNAKTNYDIFAAYNITLDYADESKKPAITSESTAATIITALRAYYESNALAEGREGAVNVTNSIANPDAMDANNGWSWSGSKNDPKNNEPWTDALGNSSHWYFDGGNWNANSWTTTMSQDLSLPAGTYLLTAKGRAATNTTLTMAVGEEDVELPHVSSTGNVFDRGWGDASLEFTTDGRGATITVTASSSTVHEWFSIADFRLVRLSLNTEVYAGETEYTALTNAINAAEAKTLGFEKTQYAPYNNVAALEALAAAKAIDQEAELTNFKTDVEAATKALTGSTWTANDTDVDAIYNGTFAETGTGSNPKGWSRSNNGWGKQITDLTAATNGVNEGTTTAWYYNNNGAWQYGNNGVYTMPLAAHQSYVLSFKYRKNGNDWQSWMKASVQNADEEGLEVVQYPGADNGATFQSAKAYFTTGAAGNYILSIEQNGNAHLTDVSLVKYASTNLEISEDLPYTPELAYYETVTLARTIKGEDTWNTFCVPFDITNEELVAKFGEDVAVAEFSDEGDDADHVTVSFNKMETPAITANTPVLLKGNAGTSFTFNDKLIKTGDAKVEGNYFDFVGSYDDSFEIPEGDYYISQNKLWKSKGLGSYIMGTRAYLKAREAAARVVSFFIDDQTTSIDETLSVKSEATDNAPIYNLNGQKMDKQSLRKGLYIQNGKKVVRK